LTAFSAASKTFVPAQNTILLNANHFFSGTKCLWLPQYVNKFSVWHKKIWTSPKHFGTCKRTRYKSDVVHSQMSCNEKSILEKTKYLQCYFFEFPTMLPNGNLRFYFFFILDDCVLRSDSYFFHPLKEESKKPFSKSTLLLASF